MTEVSPSEQATINVFFMGRGTVQNSDAQEKRFYGRIQSASIKEQKVIDDLRNAVLGKTPKSNDYHYHPADIEKIRADILSNKNIADLERYIVDLGIAASGRGVGKIGRSDESQPDHLSNKIMERSIADPNPERKPAASDSKDGGLKGDSRFRSREQFLKF